MQGGDSAASFSTSPHFILSKTYPLVPIEAIAALLVKEFLPLASLPSTALFGSILAIALTVIPDAVLLVAATRFVIDTFLYAPAAILLEVAAIIRATTSLITMGIINAVI